MTRGGRFSISVVKEVRALLPTWVACAAAMSVAALVAVEPFGRWGVFAYVWGSIQLAALSIGHEYTHGTLPLLLTLPSNRPRLLLAKLSAVLPMLAALFVVALALPAGPGFEWRQPLPMLAMVCALLVAPWLTMLCRGPLAGTVFGFGVTANVFMLADIVARVRYGWGTEAVGQEQLRLDLLRWGLLGVSIVAAAAGWRMFMRLEATEGRGADLQLPRWLRRNSGAGGAAAVSRAGRHPIWLLAMKELRLQQVTFVIASFYVVVWIGYFTTGSLTSEAREVLGAAGFLYTASLALVIGSLASAEERQLRTLEWQALLPLAAWKQWTVKAGVAFGLALFLSIGTPAFLAAGELDITAQGVGIMVVIIIILVTGGLYVSSLCDSGLRALSMSAPLMLTISVGMVWFFSFRTLSDTATASLATLTAGLVLLALSFAYENHKTPPRGTRVVGQVLWMSVVVSLAAVATYY